MSMLLFIIPAKIRGWLFSILLSVFLLFFLITVFYPEGARPWDGGEQIISVPTLLLTYFIYFLVLILLLVITRKNNKTILRLVLLLTIAGFLALPYAIYKTNITFTAQFQDGIKHINEISEDDISFGQEKNIIIILADMLQGSTVEQVLNINPLLLEKYPGFVAYTRATSPFPITTFALPSMMNGKLYSVDQNTVPPIKDASYKDGIFSDARANDYTTFLLSVYAQNDPDRTFTYSKQVQSAKAIISAGLARLFKVLIWLEHDIKDKFFVDWGVEGRDLLRRMGNANISSENNKFFFIHHLIPHSPTVFDKDGNVLDVPASDIAGYFEETEFSLKINLPIIERLQQLGLYDDALIIIVGDHGHYQGLRPRLYWEVPGADDFRGYMKAEGSTRHVAMHNPAMLVKLPQDKGEMRISHDVISNTDIRSFVQSYMQNKTLQQTQEALEKWQQDNPHHIVLFKSETPSPYHYRDMHQVFELKGNASAIPELFVSLPMEPVAHKFGDVFTAWPKGGGWLAEAKGAWLMDYPKTIRLVVDDYPSGETSLRLDVTPLVRAKHPLQRIILKINDKEIGQVDFTKSGRQDVVLDIPAGIISEDGVADITIIPLDAQSPTSMGAWDFDAPLSLFFYGIQFVAKN